MSRYRPTAEEKAAKVQAKAEARQAKAARQEGLRAWFQERKVQAQKAAKARREEVRPSRGVDRVPDRLKVGRTKALPEPIVAELGTSTLPDGRRIQGNYQARRQAGARGKPRRLRAREMPGAEARRLERRRKEWTR